jgi:hypothetical protein
MKAQIDAKRVQLKVLATTADDLAEEIDIVGSANQELQRSNQEMLEKVRQLPSDFPE